LFDEAYREDVSRKEEEVRGKGGEGGEGRGR